VPLHPRLAQYIPFPFPVRSENRKFAGMTIVLRYAIEFIATVPGVVASCYLGLLLARTLWDAPQLLLALFTDAEVSQFSIFGGLPRVTVLPPPESSAFSFAFFTGGQLLFAGLAIAVGVTVVARLPGWGRALLAFTIFWTGLLAGASLVTWSNSGGGTFGALLRAAGIGTATTPAIPYAIAAIVATLLLAGITCVVRMLATDPQEPWNLRLARMIVWVLLPVALLTLSPVGLRANDMRDMGYVPVFPILVASAAIVAATFFSRQEEQGFRLPWRGALITMALAGVVLTAALSYPDPLY
jgi:hypothetical protein